MKSFSSAVNLLVIPVALLGAVTLLVLAGRSLLWIIPTGIAILVLAVALRYWREKSLVRRFREQFGPDKDLLLVYTNSPHWRPRIENEWLKEWSHRAIVLNRSIPWRRDQVEYRLWTMLGGWHEHTPLAIVIPATGKPTIVRFFREFRDYKHGKPALLMKAETRLRQALAQSRSLTAT